MSVKPDNISMSIFVKTLAYFIIHIYIDISSIYKKLEKFEEELFKLV